MKKKVAQESDLYFLKRLHEISLEGFLGIFKLHMEYFKNPNHKLEARVMKMEAELNELRKERAGKK